MRAPTAKQKEYQKAFAAARNWAAASDSAIIAQATDERVARSYGIKPADASIILADARRQRRI